jgi:hypothetical protein
VPPLVPLTNPSQFARPLLTSVEPCQRRALDAVCRRLGLDDDAVIRAGLTLVLAMIAAATADDDTAPGEETKP